MANYNKQFNFRNGVQVDNDNFVVSPTGLVGIGTTIPTEALDVADGGNVKVSGFLTATSIFAQSLTITGGQGVTVDTGSFETIVGGGVSIKSGIVTADTTSGIVTYYGDATYLQGMPTSQWVDIDAGLGYTSIYAAGNVGVATVDPRFTFQVGGNTDTTVVGFSSGVGINSTGDVLITGVTTSGEFVGGGAGITGINAANIASGTISADRLPTLAEGNIPSSFEVTGIITAGQFSGDLVGTGVSAGIITATTEFKGSLTGTASTALSLSGTPNIEVGIATATEFKGNLTGTASTAQGLTGSPDITVTNVSAGIVTATEFKGNLTGTASTAQGLTGSPDITVTNVTSGIITATTVVSGIGSFTSIGIQTSAPSDDLQIRKESANASVKLLSDLGESRITIGTSESDTDYNAQIRYAYRGLGQDYSDDQSLDFINYGNGNINSYLQAGVVGLNTGSFHWHDKNDVIMTLTYEGNLGIGKTDPTEKLNVQGTSFFSDVATFDNGITINGTLTADVKGDLLDLSDNTVFDVSEKLFAGNVNINSGISTFNEVSTGSTIKADNIVVGGSSASRSSTAHIISGNSEQHRFYVNDSGAIGIATTFEFGNDIGITAPGKFAILGGVGVGTTVPRCAVDFTDAGTVGIGTTQPYFLPPKISNTTRNGIGETVSGATIYNTDLNKLQVYTGSAWETLTSS